MDVYNSVPRQQIIGKRMPTLGPRHAVTTDLHVVLAIVTGAGVHVGATFDQKLRYRLLAPIRRFPQHRTTVRTDGMHPARVGLDQGLHRLQVTASGGSHHNLEKIALLAGESYLSHR